ncbi:hypothetical protein AB0D44_32765, partial [Streptomyces sp. NPDC048349]
MTRRLDPGAGWYGEFLRRDPEGLQACLDGVAMPPWDVVDSLLRDLAAARGEELAAREAAYAGRLRAAAVTAWDGLPGGAEQLRTQYAAAVAQRAATRAAVRSLTARVGAAADPVEADALARELSWTHDDAARAAARHEDLSARLSALRAAPWPASPATRPDPLPGVPRQRPPAAQPAPPPAGARWTPRAGTAQPAPAAPAAPACAEPPAPVSAGAPWAGPG